MTINHTVARKRHWTLASDLGNEVLHGSQPLFLTRNNLHGILKLLMDNRLDAGGHKP